MRTTAIYVAALAALASGAAAGCGNGGTTTARDSGTGIDAAMMMGTDSGSGIDAAMMMGTDSGSGADAGSETDAGADAATMGTDASTDAGTMMGTDAGPVCGNGVIDGTESCDTAIASDSPGACPTACDDGIACTDDLRTGTGCDTRCTTTDVTTCAAGDACCPAACTAGTDADCACTPRTCAAGECGRTDNGCGMALDCGRCGVGRACDSPADCASGFCITETSSGWPGGYCSEGCTADVDCGAGAHCGYRDSETGVGACLANCEVTGDCRTGYTCRDADGAGTNECAPSATGAGAIGSACTSAAQCGGGDAGFCIVEAQGWQGGYCTRACRADTDCVGASHCGLIDATTGDGVCLANCAGGGCRTPGYACWDADGTAPTECAPAATGTGAVGAPCEATFECSGGTDGFCIDDPAFIGGYCTVTGCAADGDCPTGSHCTRFGTDPTGFCAADCSGDASCRSPGYRCFDVNDDMRNECYVAATGTGAVGDPCELTWQCAGGARGVCATEDNGFRTGYCTLAPCTASGAGGTGCPIGSHCSIQMGETEGFCTDDCASNADCRADGYRCFDSDDVDTARECFPAATGTGAVGAPCANIWDCGGDELGFCIAEDAMGDFPGGYCTRECNTVGCPTGAACVTATMAGDRFCFDSCTGVDMGDCRSGYACVAPAAGVNVCF